MTSNTIRKTQAAEIQMKFYQKFSELFTIINLSFP